ncbi:glycosyltransferase [Mycobacterium sp.]|uniref:glycosyltransferase n=1 Tax=Mycobacterium sp. TaxID=1785 RepID=UPI002CDF6B1E|nr:glycosyltransferase [Mycobacterium sp.]HME47769.1 glycosyltransferase [Mycobacterium sp.]
MTEMTQAVVVVPAHNEFTALPRCLHAVLAAAENAPIPVLVVAVLDACDDDSASLSQRFGPDVVFREIDEQNVGAARAAGFRFARSVLTSPGDRTWYATTDADTQVGPEWLLAQLDHDADVVLGVVHVENWRHHPDEVADRYERSYESDEPGHGHIHGANMGCRADAYWRVGGFRSLASGEDADLAKRFEAAGFRIHWDDDLSVATSDRRNGRAAGGFADHLVALAREVAAEGEAS